MKIVHVVDSMEVGGAEVLVSQMCQLQREQGHDPSIYAVAALGALGEKLQAEGFPVRAGVGQHLLDSTRNFFHLFKQSRPDALHIHNPTPTIYAAPAARAAGVPRIVSTRHSLVAPPHHLAAELKYAVASRFCDWIVGICEATTNNVRTLHTVSARKITCVYNGAAPLKLAAKESWPEKSGFTLVYVGRLQPIKNHPLLLNAFQVALAVMPDLQLWIVGSGSERAMLEAMAGNLGIAKQVTFWGQQLDVAPFFSAADAFVMSSKSEGLPVSLLQAFSLGLPAIVTDVGGMAEVVRLANAGFIVPPDDRQQLAAAILRMARSPKDREQFSKNAEAAFGSRFSLQTMVAAYMDLYQNPR